MRILAWDTSSKTGAVVAFELDGTRLEIKSEWTLNVEAVHSEQLLWAIDQILKSVRWSINEIDAFGVGTGPGSFTGLRIGLTTARTMADRLEKPLVGVSSLAGLLWGATRIFSATHPSANPLIIAATDAAKGEVFASMARPSDWGAEPLEEAAVSPEVLVSKIEKALLDDSDLQYLTVGSGTLIYPEEWERLPQDRRIQADLPMMHAVQGRYLAERVTQKYLSEGGESALEVKPRYLRASAAELKLEKGLLPPGPTRG